MRRRLSLLSIVVLAFCQLTPAAALPSAACSCGGVTLAQRIEGADPIVTGRVRRVRGKDGEVAIVAVDRYLKGSGPGAIIVVGGEPYRPDTCDVSFAGRNGERLLFFLYYDEELG